MQLGRVFFYLAYHGRRDKPFQETLARTYRSSFSELEWTAPHCIAGAVRQLDSRIRIAFISRFFSNHTIAKLNMGLMTLLSRDLFEVHVYQLGKRDWMSEKIARSVENFTYLYTVDLDEIRRKVASWKPDIVYYTDIGMEPLTYFLAFSRLARIQCVTWGHPVTTGIPTIDWFISHSACERGTPQNKYSEKLFCLPEHVALTYYYRPVVGPVSKNRADFCLPDNLTLYVCPQSLFKIHPEFDGYIAKILQRDPNGRIVFIRGLNQEHETLLRQRWSGIPEQEERILFVPFVSQQDYFDLMRLSDVMLDTPHFCGGNSTAEALAVGIPVVTLPSQFLKGRLTYAWYRRMNFMECVTHSEEEYVEVAVHLGTDVQYREHIRKQLRDKSGVIFEDIGVIREMEAFFQTEVERLIR